jgi:hypothetical protein
MEAKKDRTVVKRVTKNFKLYNVLKDAENSDEYCHKYVGIMKDEEPDQIWPIDKPLSKKEVDDYLRMNKLRRLYLECEKWEIVQLGDIKEEVDEIPYWDFVLFLTQCYECLGEQYVNYILEPLGFKQERYVTTKRLK